ncbi:MAG: enoyl-CoA hydratase/isomerase family protein [Syntrophobacteraceae bacterium]|nr:enoyl-CoA hydratase/isomerase family protein [Syntrophobacteraceae bacterium]
MKTEESLVRDNEQFSSFLDKDILVIKEKQPISSFARDIVDIFHLYDYMEHALSSKAYKSLVLFSRSEPDLPIEYDGFLSKIFSGKQDPFYLDRFLNVANRFILSLAALDRMTVFAGQGTLSVLSLTTALAYDYRIVADNTVFENPDLDFGLVTKGSGYFLPRLLGILKATEMLQWRSFTAEDALQLGLVDQIVPVSRLEAETLEFVSKNQSLLSTTLVSLRKLFKCDIKELKRSLELEDSLIKERLISEELRRRFAAERESQGRLL